MSNNTKKTNEIKFTVKGKTGTFTFGAIAHKANCPEEFFLDPIEFYQKRSKTIPSGEHWELEILEPGENFLIQYGLHKTESARSANLFVCYPASLPSLKSAKALFRLWCVGSVLTVEQGIDLNDSYKGDFDQFLAELDEKYEITLLEECE